MTDKQALFSYRLTQAKETLVDAEMMLQGNLTPRSILNRAYYSMFYAILALFLNEDVPIKTSKHIGVISIFDKEFVHTGKIDKHYSKILHKMFEIRQEGDYKEFIEISVDEADKYVKYTREFLQKIEEIIRKKSWV
ncbi:HEPN domain-containing protein [bacterium]|nr:HEPN domain-containing protein [bacterium]MBU0899467.1 HEPN domain-containing protein [bacterium]MBU1152524.1 HEPN domain-containing protein [bacterium]MBU1781978.1 HEPN domain-containing protein [bacterium]MBU2599304.1 HEPN domain-containing protein [bacterium]